MNSDDEIPSDDVDSGNVSSGDDVDFAMEVESNASREKQSEAEEYPFEVLSTEQIVQHMVDSIKDVNSVIQVRIFFSFTSLSRTWLIHIMTHPLCILREFKLPIFTRIVL